MDNIKKHIPNILTTIRLIMALLIPLVFLYAPLPVTLGYFLVGDITDALDGFLARKWQVQSKYGKIIDPFADKLFNGLTLLFTSVFVNPLLFILTGFEATIAGISIFRISKKRDFSVSQVGRIKTVFLFFTIIMSLIQPLLSSLTIFLNSLIATTAVLQGVTTYKYLKECYEENKITKNVNVGPKEISEKQKIIEELKAKKKELEKEKRDNMIKYLAKKAEKNNPFKYENSETKKENDDSNYKSKSK